MPSQTRQISSSHIPIHLLKKGKNLLREQIKGFPIEMVEDNAASAEENPAISAELGDCAQMLMNTIAQFQLKK